MSLEDYINQPNFIPHQERGIIPFMPLPKDFREAIPKFYQEDKRKKIDEFVKVIERSFPDKGLDLKLQWDETLGLTDISLSSQASAHLDEDTGEFIEHNLGQIYSLIAMAIFLKYRAELIKYL